MAEPAIIDDSTPRHLYVNPVIDGQVMHSSCWGMRPRGWSSGLPTFSEQSTVPLIPERDWDDIIRQQEKDKTRIRDFVFDMGLTCLNQGQTNFCWANGPTYSAMITRLKETGQCVRLSPASVAWPIKRGNRGGWGLEAYNYAMKYGWNLQEDYPPNELGGRSGTPENKEKAKKNIILEGFVCETWEEWGSAILAGFGVATGRNHWSHLTCDIEISLGDHDAGTMNSWSESWGLKGFGWLKGSKKRFDMEAVAITSMVPA